MIIKFKFIIWLLRQPIQTDETPIQINETSTSSRCVSISILWISSLILFDVADLFHALHWPRQASKRRKMPREMTPCPSTRGGAKALVLASSMGKIWTSSSLSLSVNACMFACTVYYAYTQSTVVIKPTDFMTKSGMTVDRCDQLRSLTVEREIDYLLKFLILFITILLLFSIIIIIIKLN